MFKVNLGYRIHFQDLKVKQRDNSITLMTFVENQYCATKSLIHIGLQENPCRTHHRVHKYSLNIQPQALDAAI